MEELLQYKNLVKSIHDSSVLNDYIIEGDMYLLLSCRAALYEMTIKKILSELEIKQVSELDVQLKAKSTKVQIKLLSEELLDYPVLEWWG